MLRVETDDGEVGWGEAIGDLHQEVEQALAAIGERVKEVRFMTSLTSSEFKGKIAFGEMARF